MVDPWTRFCDVVDSGGEVGEASASSDVAVAVAKLLPDTTDAEQLRYVSYIYIYIYISIQHLSHMILSI